MTAERIVLPLAACMEAIIDYRGKTPTKTKSGIPLVTAKVVKGGRINTPDEFIAESDYEAWMRRGVPRAGDVVVTTEAPLGEVAQLGGQRVALAQRLITLRGKPELLDNTFLKFLMQSENVQSQLLARASGTTVFGIKQSELRKVLLSIPPLPEQHAIAHILGSLDDKIELNRRMNETLEDIARALFQSWFVDFDPVNAKAEGHQPLGMDAETASLLPDSFQESEVGLIPTGWQMLPLNEFLEVNPPRTLAKGASAPYLDMGNMPTTSARAIEFYDRPFGSGSRFKDGDTLLARITPCLENGKTCLVDFLGDNKVGWGSTEYIVLRPHPPLPVQYAYLLARKEGFRSFAIANMTGTSGRQRVPASALSHYSFPVPSENVAVRFGEIISPFFNAMKVRDAESETLASLRDTLLPKLISGELRVPDAEKLPAESPV